jgi:hypothetical protein
MTGRTVVDDVRNLLRRVDLISREIAKSKLDHVVLLQYYRVYIYMLELDLDAQLTTTRSLVSHMHDMFTERHGSICTIYIHGSNRALLCCTC